MFVPRSDVTTYRSAGTAMPDLATQSLSSETAAAVGSGVVGMTPPSSGGGIGANPIGTSQPSPSQPPSQQPSPPSSGGRGFGPIGPTPPIITLPIAGAPLPPLRRPPILAPPGGIRSPPGAGRIHCLGPECGPIQWPIPIRRPPPLPPIHLPVTPLPILHRRPPPQPPHLPPVSPPQPPQPPIRLPPPPLPPLGRYWHPRPRPAPVREAPRPAGPFLILTSTRGAPVRLSQVATNMAGRLAAVGNVLGLFRPLSRTEMANVGAAHTVTRTVTRNEATAVRGTATVQNVQSPILTQRLNEVYAPIITRTTGTPTTVVARRTVGNVGTRAIGNVQGGVSISGPQGSVYIPAQELLAAASG